MSTAALGLQSPRLPKSAPAVAVVIAAALAGLLGLLLGWNLVAIGVVALIVFNLALPVWSVAVEGKRVAKDRLATGLVWTAVIAALAPLIWLLWKVVSEGASTITWDFLTHDMTQRMDPVTFKLQAGAGVWHAIIGTLIITLIAAAISVPVGLMAAIYLVEYGGTGKRRGLAPVLTLLVDVMTGIPSIVAGLFALALFTLFFGTGTHFGFMGSIALSLLMIPTVVRSTEEMIRLVPNDLREASYALGVPKWRTILKVVVPTSIGGIVTGVMLAISRVIGETAPLLVAVGTADVVNWNPFSAHMQTLPVYIMTQYTVGTPASYKNAWGAALLLILIVMILNLIARVIGKIFAPKTGR